MNVFYLSVIVFLFSTSLAAQSLKIEHKIAAVQKNYFHGWPANNGVWVWGDEILVGFTQVEYAKADGHNIKENAPFKSLLTRSKDGGKTWTMFDPENYVGDGGTKSKLQDPVNFKHENFAMRILGSTYHGNNDPDGAFYYSYDKGNTWNGPFYLGDIHKHKRFEARILTPRTDYIALSEKECLIFITSRIDGTGLSDDISVIKTNDGGLTFKLISPWVVPCEDPYRNAMPNTVQLDKDEMVMVARRRNISDRNQCWIDAYKSDDGGYSWRFTSKVGDTGEHNGNPPALVKLDDGRLCAIYGNRTTLQILGRYSNDHGETWEPEFVIRDDFIRTETGRMRDLGYPRIVQTKEGNVVAIYYWATEENPQQHIAASIWKP
ncbi:MAG: sialidase family protein [candidate division KSB1 bacterium]|nr:sialidase family protein [candidate division KSB1 bacterium]